MQTASHPRRSVLPSLAIVLLVAALLVFNAAQTRQSSDRTVGFFPTNEEGPGMVVGDVIRGAPAQRGGLQAGDRILAIGGSPILMEGDYDHIARSFRLGGAFRFEIQRGEGRLELEIRPGVPFPWGRFLIHHLLISLAYVAVALLSLQQFADLRARLLTLFTLAVAVELALPETPVGMPALGLLLGTLFLLVSGAQMGLELHLASVIPRRQGWLRRQRWVIPGYYAAGLGLGGIAAVTALAEALGERALPWSAAQSSFAFYSVGMPLWALAVPALLLIPALTYPHPQGRHQAGLVLAGVFPWTAYVLITTGHELLSTPPPQWLNAAFPWALLCYPVAVFVAIFKYQLFDIERVVRRSLLYTALTTVLLLIFYAALGAGGVLASELFEQGRESVWVVAGATLLLGLLFTPLRRWLEKEIYRRFFPDRVALRQRLVALAGELPSLGALPKMGSHLARSLCEILRVRSASVLIADPVSGLLVGLASTRPEGREGLEQSLLLSPDDPGLRLLASSGRPFAARALAAKSPEMGARLERLRADVVVPLSTPERLIGLLVLGSKQTADRYHAEEMELLHLLAHHVAGVLENARLFESATLDGLTGLLRRETILERLQDELQRAQRYGRPLSIGLADLDHFKHINDLYGHLTGDAVLKWAARRLASGLRATDLVGRYGGEEFLLVLPETDLAGAVRLAEKIRSLVAGGRAHLEGGQEVALTLSIGLGSLSDFEHRPVSVNELIAQADRSLYRAKEMGRNQVRPAVA